jgi:rubrerythrin
LFAFSGLHGKILPVKIKFTEKNGGMKMAVWKCKNCGFSKEGRCKPQKCPKCQEKGGFEKEE